MLRGLSDQELKEVIRVLARGADLDLSEARIEVMLPQFKQQLEWLDRLKSFRLPIEAEPSIVFRLRPRGSRKKKRPR